MPAMRVTRRHLIAGSSAGLAAFVMAGGVSRAQDAPDTASPAASPQASGMRTVETPMGSISIPVSPQRVVALDGPVLDACFALGVTPVGATTGVAAAPWPTYLGDGTAVIANVGDIAEPNLEQIAALNPDLIISLTIRHEAIYEQLSGIAPTVLSPYDFTHWRDSFGVFADALNKAAEAPAVVEAFDNRVSELQEGLGEARDSTTVSVVRVLTGELRSYQAASFSGTVLEAVGLPRPDAQQGMDDTWLPLSLEELNTVDASVIFVTLWSGSTQEDLDGLISSPLWESLPAVAAGKVYLVPDEYWMTAIGYLAAGLILDDLQAYLVEGADPPAVG